MCRRVKVGRRRAGQSLLRRVESEGGEGGGRSEKACVPGWELGLRSARSRREGVERGPPKNFESGVDMT